MRTYSYKHWHKRLVETFGEPVVTPYGVWCVWHFGESILRLYQLATKPDRCTLSYTERPKHYVFAGDYDPRGRINRLKTDDVVRRFAAQVSVTLTYGVSIGLHPSTYAPCVWHNGLGYSAILPPDVVRLCWGFLRGEVPGEMLLDALKHDTEILG